MPERESHSSDRWYGAVSYSEDVPWGLGEDATYYNTPGAVNEYLAWTGGLEEGNRGVPLSREFTGIEITGTDEVMANLEKIVNIAHDAAIKRLRLNAERILSASKKEIPWKTTHLMQTGTIEPVDGDPDAFQIGYNTPYAEKQHEDMTLNHPKPGTKAKYLEDPAMRIAPTIAADIVNALREHLS